MVFVVLFVIALVAWALWRSKREKRKERRGGHHRRRGGGSRRGSEGVRDRRGEERGHSREGSGIDGARGEAPQGKENTDDVELGRSNGRRRSSAGGERDRNSSDRRRSGQGARGNSTRREGRSSVRGSGAVGGDGHAGRRPNPEYEMSGGLGDAPANERIPIGQRPLLPPNQQRRVRTEGSTGGTIRYGGRSPEREAGRTRIRDL